ncbi:hypothetical protein HMPREF9406_2989 [Clostridium sp. HGF2]|nr:hypothetical protein HMPREF9406_2989 [Clostridium sp. HGF2]
MYIIVALLLFENSTSWKQAISAFMHKQTRQKLNQPLPCIRLD